MHGDCQDFFGQLLLITLSDHWGSCFNLFIEFHKPVALGMPGFAGNGVRTPRWTGPNPGFGPVPGPVCEILNFGRQSGSGFALC